MLDIPSSEGDAWLACHRCGAERCAWAAGSVVIILAGVSSGFFSPAFNLASNDQWHKLAPGVHPLTTYTGYFWCRACLPGGAPVAHALDSPGCLSLQPAVRGPQRLSRARLGSGPPRWYSCRMPQQLMPPVEHELLTLHWLTMQPQQRGWHTASAATRVTALTAGGPAGHRFCICYLLLAVVETHVFLYYPPLGLPKSSWRRYFTVGALRPPALPCLL